MPPVASQPPAETHGPAAGGAGKATPPRAALAPAVYDFGASLLGMRRV